MRNLGIVLAVVAVLYTIYSYGQLEVAKQDAKEAKAELSIVCAHPMPTGDKVLDSLATQVCQDTDS